MGLEVQHADHILPLLKLASDTSTEASCKLKQTQDGRINADKIKSDSRLPFGLSGVNNKGKVSCGNYVWISYFYSYLSEQS